MGGTECGSERVELGIERGRRFSARRSQLPSTGSAHAAIESICLIQEAFGKRLSSVIPKRSTSGDVKGVPCGTNEMFRTYASSRLVSIVISPAHRTRAKLKRSAGGVNARRPCGTHGRSAAESVDAAEHRMKIQMRWASDPRQPGEEMTPAERSHNHSVIASNDRLRIATNRAPDCRLDLRSDPKSIVRKIGVRNPLQDLSHAAGT